MTVTIESRQAEIRKLRHAELRAARRVLRAQKKWLEAKIKIKRKKIQTVREICKGQINHE